MKFHRFVLTCGPLACIGFLLNACVSDVETSRPLIDTNHRADVLVEGRLLSNPRSMEQNRLLRGWRFVRRDGGRWLIPIGPESVVEIVNLRQRPRQLIIDVAEYKSGDSVQVLVGRRQLGRFPISDQTKIDLPIDLPLGRAAVTLGFSNLETTVLSSLSISPNVAVGAVVIDPGVIEQRGWSAVEVVHRVTAHARFAAEFHPPTSAEPGERFLVSVEREHEPAAEVFSWDSATTPRQTGVLKIDVPLGQTTGPVRIRLLAEGTGVSARWVNPRIVGTDSSDVGDRPIILGEPPKLVVLYIMDALRADHVGHLGVSKHLTPVLDQIASEGVTYSNHFAVAPNTPPSTRALFSGLCMLDDRQLPVPGPTRLAEVFAQGGYRTISITGNPHLSPTLDLGVGFESVELHRVREDHNPKHPPTINNSAEILHEVAKEWIEDLPPDQQGFLYIHSMNPHNPYTPPPGFEERFVPPGPSTVDGRTRTLVAIRDLQLEPTQDDAKRLRALYGAGVAYNDAELGTLLDVIHASFEPEDVLLIVTSDHGEELLEHGGVLHGYTLYDEMLHIPLVVRWPGRIERQEISSLTNTLDLHASLVELASPHPKPTTGRSLWNEAGTLAAGSINARVTFAAAPGLDGGIMARSDTWKLIIVPREGLRRGQGKGRGRSWDLEYVFDIEADPAERFNLAGTPSLEVAWLRTRLMAWVEAERVLQPSPGDQVMEAEIKDQLEALGYVVDH